jgi:hypothetical protein
MALCKHKGAVFRALFVLYDTAPFSFCTIPRPFVLYDSALFSLLCQRIPLTPRVVLFFEEGNVCSSEH